MKTMIHSLIAMAIALFAASALAQTPSYGTDINLEGAKKVGASALVYYDERMDDTQTASPRIAVAKARTAAMFRRPSKALEDGIAGGRVSLLGLPGATPIDGGLPIVVGGKIIGGVGVSGVQSHEDAQCARAGLDALK